MEANLRKLNEQEVRYSAELNDSLHLYKRLQTQAEKYDVSKQQDKSVEMAADRLQRVYGNDFDAQLLHKSKQEVSRMLGKADTPVSLQKQLVRRESESHEKHTRQTEKDMAR